MLVWPSDPCLPFPRLDRACETRYAESDTGAARCGPFCPGNAEPEWRCHPHVVSHSIQAQSATGPHRPNKSWTNTFTSTTMSSQKMSGQSIPSARIFDHRHPVQKQPDKLSIRPSAAPGCQWGHLTLAYLLYGDRPSLAMIRTEPHLIPLLVFFVLVRGPIAEELFGLRGFALPRLLNRYNPLDSSIIVGFYFGAWHLIEFFRPGSSQYASGLGFYPLFIVSEIAHSVMMTWIYLRSQRNLFVAGIFYLSA